MIQGLGNDIIEIGRIERVITQYGPRFLDRLFTTREQEYCLRHNKSARHFAGRFAAKEAVVKALGTGIRDGISWLDIEIVNDEKGKPDAVLSPALVKQFPSCRLHLSISHSHDYATAVAIMESAPL